MDLNDDENIVLKFIPEYSLYSLVICTPISVFVCSPTLRKTTPTPFLKFSRYFRNILLLVC